jgi:hypothetical protein
LTLSFKKSFETLISKFGTGGSGKGMDNLIFILVFGIRLNGKNVLICG